MLSRKEKRANNLPMVPFLHIVRGQGLPLIQPLNGGSANDDAFVD
jgi:hypothetical protein